MQGEADTNKVTRARCDLYAVKPTDFRALVPKLEVKAGDRVRAGDPLFSDKYRPEVKFTAPVSGTVEEVRRGEKRRVMAVVVRADERIAYKPFDAPSLDKLTRERLVALMLESGLWPLIKQRPYDIVADPGRVPRGCS